MPYTKSQLKAHIREVQGYLQMISIYDASIPRILPDGIYGEETAEAVRAFQKKHGLKDSGEVNRATWEKIAEIYRLLAEAPKALDIFPRTAGAVIREGDAGLAVMVIQAILHTLALEFDNLPDVAVTGVYDPQTVRAVQLFRGMSALSSGNDVNKETWNQLALAAGDARR